MYARLLPLMVLLLHLVSPVAVGDLQEVPRGPSLPMRTGPPSLQRASCGTPREGGL